MSPRNDHFRAQELMLSPQLEKNDSLWLEQHLADCEGCHTDFVALEGSVAELRGINRSITASRSLVRATQARVHERAAELRQHEERMGPLWIAVALAALWAVISAPFIWSGAQYLGHAANLPALVWETGAVFFWLMPTGLITALTLYARGLRTITE